MANYKHDSNDKDKKYKSSLTEILGVIGRRDGISVADMHKDPNLGGRYVYPLLKKLCPENDTVLIKRLFCWNELITIPKKTEERLMKNIRKLLPNEQNIVVGSGSKEISDSKRQAQLRVSQKENHVRFQIEYDLERIVVRGREIEKHVFYDHTFKVITLAGGKESSITKDFSLYRKSGMLYVYSIDYSSRYVRGFVNKTLDISKIEKIHKIIKEQTLERIIEIINQNLRVETGLDYKTIGRSPIFHVLLCRNLIRYDYERIVESVIEGEFENLKRRESYWSYSLNARGLIDFCLKTQSESEINEVIAKIWSNPLYCYQHDTDVSNDKNHGIKNANPDINIQTLDFPFLLYHNEITKVLPQNFVTTELKQIAKKLIGLIDNTLLHELTYFVTSHYFNRFYEFMNMKPIIGKDSHIEEIKSNDTNMYRIIMDYQVNILRYLKSIEERKLQDTSRMLNLTNMLLEEEPKSHGRLAMQFYLGTTEDGRLAILEPKFSN